MQLVYENRVPAAIGKRTTFYFVFLGMKFYYCHMSLLTILSLGIIHFIMIDNLSVDSYCFIAAADELFVFDSLRFSSIYNLVEKMERQGDSLLKHSPYFDERSDTIIITNKEIEFHGNQ